MQKEITQLKENFEKMFGSLEGTGLWFAPGRVNLIGEHTDYNGGHVFPCALTLGTWALARKREDDLLRFYSMNFSRAGLLECQVKDLKPDSRDGWINYPKGVIWALQKRGYAIDQGMEVMIWGNIPAGSGLSSSASIEVLTGLLVRDLFGLQGLSMIDLALVGQYAENNFNGMNCGIMDQFASAMGKKDCAIFLDTNSLAYEHVPVRLGDAGIVIVNSRVKHSLVDSAYNDRRRESEQALSDLQKASDIRTLGDLEEAHFERLRETISDPVCEKRARHAVYENQRTIRAVKALKKNDIRAFGQLMKDSHVSLRDDYEVSCPEIDFLVSEAWAHPGVIGARITGGGFGGCTVNIVEKDAIGAFTQDLQKAYKDQWGLEADFYAVEIGDGAHRAE